MNHTVFLTKDLFDFFRVDCQFFVNDNQGIRSFTFIDTKKNLHNFIFKNISISGENSEKSGDFGQPYRTEP